MAKNYIHTNFYASTCISGDPPDIRTVQAVCVFQKGSSGYKMLAACLFQTILQITVVVVCTSQEDPPDIQW